VVGVTQTSEFPKNSDVLILGQTLPVPDNDAADISLVDQVLDPAKDFLADDREFFRMNLGFCRGLNPLETISEKSDFSFHFSGNLYYTFVLSVL
jgi:hypothetical protein